MVHPAGAARRASDHLVLRGIGADGRLQLNLSLATVGRSVAG